MTKLQVALAELDKAIADYKAREAAELFAALDVPFTDESNG